MAFVKNASGSSRWPKPSTGESSWLEYWESIRGKRQPVVVLPIAIPLANSLVVTSRLFLVVMNYTSPLCAKVVIIALTISGLTQNWLEYPAASKPHRGMQRLKCSVAESESHRIVFHYLTPSVYEKRDACCF